MNNPLGVSLSEGNPGTTRGREKNLLTSVRIGPTTIKNSSDSDLYDFRVTKTADNLTTVAICSNAETVVVILRGDR